MRRVSQIGERDASASRWFDSISDTARDSISRYRPAVGTYLPACKSPTPGSPEKRPGESQQRERRRLGHGDCSRRPICDDHVDVEDAVGVGGRTGLISVLADEIDVEDIYDAVEIDVAGSVDERQP